MTAPMPSPDGPYPRAGGPEPPPRPRARVDAGQLWAGGVATAFVAGLIALVGVLVCRWLFAIPILAPRRDGAYGDAHTTTLILVAAAAALAATLLAHLLLASTPRPMTFLAWIVGLVTVIFVVFPFRTGAPWPEKIATAVLYLVIGLAIATLLASVGERATRHRPATTAPTTTQHDYQDLR
jgi:uncharacterized protein DUF6069